MESSFILSVLNMPIPGRRVFSSAISATIVASTCVRALTRNATPLRSFLAVPLPHSQPSMGDADRRPSLADRFSRD